jgi:pyrroline-5-carboxylate reductase
MKIAIIGAGNMGLAFASAFLSKKLIAPEELWLVEPRVEAHADLKAQGYVHIIEKPGEQLATCQLLVLAVKPQDFATLASQLRPFVSSSQLVLSMMAGVTMAKMEQLLGLSKIVRCMPNTPAKLGLGVTGYVAQQLSRSEEEWVQKLLEGIGKTVPFSEERLIDAVTAISGSGPAYFYYFLKSMVEAGVQMGMEEDLAKKLACETMLGTYHLIQHSSVGFDELIAAVKSKGGTTEAALNTFESNHVGTSIRLGVINAEKRAKELSNSISQG